MGNFLQCIVDEHVSEADAARMGDAVRRWLVKEGIISAEPKFSKFCTEPGYPPGPHYDKAVVEPCQWLVTLVFNEPRVITGRHVFDAGQ